jgi:hypothetical protein
VELVTNTSLYVGHSEGMEIFDYIQNANEQNESTYEDINAIRSVAKYNKIRSLPQGGNDDKQ